VAVAWIRCRLLPVAGILRPLRSAARERSFQPFSVSRLCFPRHRLDVASLLSCLEFDLVLEQAVLAEVEVEEGDRSMKRLTFARMSGTWIRIHYDEEREGEASSALWRGRKAELGSDNQ